MPKLATIFGIFATFVPSVAMSVISACGSDSTVGTTSNPPGRGGGGAVSFTLPTGTSGGAGGGAGGGASGTQADVWPPAGYINVTNASYGAYALGPLLSSLGGSSGGHGGTGGTPGVCSGLYGVVRDFKMSTKGGSNPDFEQPPQDDRGVVTDTLGSDGKPVYGDHASGTPTTHGKDYFDQWYRDVDGVNMSYLVGLHFVQNGSVVTFAATIGNTGGVPNVDYFPLDIHPPVNTNSVPDDFKGTGHFFEPAIDVLWKM